MPELGFIMGSHTVTGVPPSLVDPFTVTVTTPLPPVVELSMTVSFRTYVPAVVNVAVVLCVPELGEPVLVPNDFEGVPNVTPAGPRSTLHVEATG